VRLAILALSGAVALSGCASDKLTLLENEDGAETGAVAIIDEETGADKALVDTKLTEAKLTSRPKPRAVKELKPAYTELLGNLPRKAERFTILFGTDEFRIPEAQRGTIELIRKELERRPPGAQIEVVGFTDTTGEAVHNLKISEKRAQDVISELNGLGFTVDPNDAVGRGELAAQESGDPENYNNELFRKVEVVVR